MARNPNTSPPRLPLFDRLLQGDSSETDIDTREAVRALREGVRRDLEILFNTRPHEFESDPARSELERSVLTFGLPDIQDPKLSTEEQQEHFRTGLEARIRRFEPRLGALQVERIAHTGMLERTLRFRIRAVLKTDTVRETVTYDTVVDPTTGALQITSGRDFSELGSSQPAPGKRP